MSLDHQMAFQIFLHTVTCCRPVCLVCVANDRIISFLPSATFLKDPTEPEEQTYLLLLYGLRFRQLRGFLIGMELTCRDSNTSVHKHEQVPMHTMYDSVPGF